MTAQGGEVSISHERIVSVLRLLEISDFVYEGLSKIERPWSEYSPDRVFATIREYVPNQDLFGFWTQSVGGVQKAFTALYISENLYHEKEGMVWLLYCSKGARLREFNKEPLAWLASNRVVRLSACDTDMNPVKQRWLRRQGFETKFQVLERTDLWAATEHQGQ